MARVDRSDAIAGLAFLVGGWGMQTLRSQPKESAKTMFHPLLNNLVIIVCCFADTPDRLSVLANIFLMAIFSSLSEFIDEMK